MYIRRNGSFQVEPLLEGALAASTDAAAGVAWVADLSSAAADPVQFLAAIIDRPWIPEAQKDVLYRRIVEEAQAQFAQTLGEPRLNAQEQVLTWRLSWVEYLLVRGGENTRALENSFADSCRMCANSACVKWSHSRFESPRVCVRCRLNWRVMRNHFRWSLLADAAAALFKDGDAPSARRVLEFVVTTIG